MNNILWMHRMQQGISSVCEESWPIFENEGATTWRELWWGSAEKYGGQLYTSIEQSKNVDGEVAAVGLVFGIFG